MAGHVHPENVAMSYEQIAAELHITRQRAKQLCDRAILKIQRELARRGLKDISDLVPDDPPPLDG